MRSPRPMVDADFGFTTQLWAILKSIYAKAERTSKRVTEENGNNDKSGVPTVVNSNSQNKSESKASPGVSLDGVKKVCLKTNRNALPGKKTGSTFVRSLTHLRSLVSCKSANYRENCNLGAGPALAGKWVPEAGIEPARPLLAKGF